MPKRSDDNAHWSPDMSGGVPADKRAADFVFEKLAGAIIRGEMKVGTVLTGERELAEKFGISRVIIREAIHRLKDLELVRVKQGGQTIILDPQQSPNPRMIPLLVEQAAPSARTIRELTERQILEGYVLLELAEGRVTNEDCDDLDRIIDSYRDAGDDKRLSFIRDFWLRLAQACHNTFLWREGAFWFQMSERYNFGGQAYMPIQERMQLHREVVQKLREGKGALAHFREALRPLFDMFTQMARAEVEAEKAAGAKPKT